MLITPRYSPKTAAARSIPPSPTYGDVSRVPQAEDSFEPSRVVKHAKSRPRFSFRDATKAVGLVAASLVCVPVCVAAWLTVEAATDVGKTVKNAYDLAKKKNYLERDFASLLETGKSPVGQELRQDLERVAAYDRYSEKRLAHWAKTRALQTATAGAGVVMAMATGAPVACGAVFGYMALKAGISSLMARSIRNQHRHEANSIEKFLETRSHELHQRPGQDAIALLP